MALSSVSSMAITSHQAERLRQACGKQCGGLCRSRVKTKERSSLSRDHLELVWRLAAALDQQRGCAGARILRVRHQPHKVLVDLAVPVVATSETYITSTTVILLTATDSCNRGP